MEFTKSQQDAISLRGSSLLVSAAAGSGKTSVLVERLMRYLTDENDAKNINDFLVITYTRAAAAELRSKIFGEISKRLAENPSSRHLRRQTALCHKAPIGTIHSFCQSILRESAHQIGLSPDFRVLDEARAQKMKDRALEDVLDAAYEGIGENEDFRRLADTAGAGRDDSRLIKIVLSLHADMQSHPYPGDWARSQTEAMDGVGELSDASETVWGREILTSARDTAAYWALRLERMLEALRLNPDTAKLLDTWGDSLCLTAAGLRDFLRASEAGWDSALEFAEIPFPRFNPLKNFPDENLAAHVKAVREQCKKAAEKISKNFDLPSAALFSDMRATASAMKALLRLVLDFDKAYSAEKRRLGVLDFSDLEHFAVKLLVDKETGEPSRAAKDISERYTEIMVDEYQDVNRVQDMIFSAVSRDGRNLFMVGDVKQSIYRFRLADPGIFLEKYRSCNAPDSAAEGAPRLVLLRENFRSREEILSPVNDIFRKIMSAKLGEIEYDDDASLIPGASFPPVPDARVCFRVTDVPKELGISRSERSRMEAREIARYLKRLVSGGEGGAVWDNGAQRPMRYGDIVVLTRSDGGVHSLIRRELLLASIPVSGARGGGFFQTAEIAVAMSLLAIVDNPLQDVPLISVLRSPVFGFTPDELTMIRAAAMRSDFYTALRIRADADGKCRAFLDLLYELRGDAENMTAPAFVWHAFDKTGMLAAFSAMPDGASRRENLMLFFEYARRFEENGYRGLFSFTRHMRTLMERGEEPRAGAGAADGVRVMSIHKSKGLEFPVVVLADTSRQFNREDAREPVLIHPKLGLGPKFTDLDRGVEYPTLARRAVASRITQESISEEMRVLYVALTRAKERLIVSCALEDAEEKLVKLQGDADGLSPEILSSDSSPANWLLRAFFANGLPLELVPASSDEADSAEAKQSPERYVAEVAPEAVEALREKLEFSYPYLPSVSLPSKLTATELKDYAGGEGDSEAEPIVPPVYNTPPRRPDFYAQKKGLTPAERGVALHLVMQYIDYGKCSSDEGIRAEIGRLLAQQFITGEQAAVVEPAPILGFFSSALGRRVLACDSLLREFRFSLVSEAAEYYPDAPQGEKILLQGVVDCCIEENGELTIIDYKTDYINKITITERTALYEGQLRAYSKALTRITGKRVKSALLYFFALGEAVEVAL